MAVQETTGKQLACKITNLKAMSRKADDDDTASSKFFRALQPAKLVAFRKIDVEEEKAKARLERNQSEAKILAKLSHVRIDTSYHYHLRDADQRYSQISSIFRRSFSQRIRCESF